MFRLLRHAQGIVDLRRGTPECDGLRVHNGYLIV